jgi:hypothetical protein
MASVCATIIGLGAVGRQVAVQLAAIGVRRMQLIDFDQVEPSNLSTQAYFTEELGTPKVVASRRAIGRIDPSIVVDSICDRYRPKTSIGNAVFCCVDNIASRATIWRTIEHRCDFWADGRMRPVESTTPRPCFRRRKPKLDSVPRAVRSSPRQSPAVCLSTSSRDGFAICQLMPTHRSISWLAN